MERYLMYLRKSRMDTDFEEVSIAETLSRHRTTLEKFCKSKRLNVVEVLEEVVSGESLAARPEMMRLLELVSTGAYAGVVCMDIERLSRGSSMESGYIMQILQVNGCKIVTPGKTYDLQNESDEQFPVSACRIGRGHPPCPAVSVWSAKSVAAGRSPPTYRTALPDLRWKRP